MANKNFVVHNGLTVGALTIDAATGDISTPGNVNISGSLGVSQIAKNDSSVVINDTGSGSTVSITIDGTTEHTVDADGVNIASGDRYAINGTSVLNATTLGTNVVNSSLTSVGTLTKLAITNDIADTDPILTVTNRAGIDTDLDEDLVLFTIEKVESIKDNTVGLYDRATDKNGKIYILNGTDYLIYSNLTIFKKLK